MGLGVSGPDVGFDVSGLDVSGFDVSGLDVSGPEVCFDVSGLDVSDFDISSPLEGIPSIRSLTGRGNLSACWVTDGRLGSNRWILPPSPPSAWPQSKRPRAGSGFRHDASVTLKITVHITAQHQPHHDCHSPLSSVRGTTEGGVEARHQSELRSFSTRLHFPVWTHRHLPCHSVVNTYFTVPPAMIH